MIAMDDDDDYFTPTTTSSRRLAMLFSPEDMISNSTMGHHTDPSKQFRFVAPKQPRPGRSSSSASTSSGTGQASPRDSQEVLLEVALSVVPQGPDRNKMPKIQVNCQVVGNAVRKTFTLVVIQTKGELWRAVVDSQLLLEVVDQSTLRVAVHGKSLILLGDTEQIKALVTQLAIYRAVASDGPSQQDLCVGKGHVLGEGDVAKVSCTTYTITSTALRGEKVEELRGVKVTVSPATGGGWERCLAGATVDSHRLIFLPKQREGKWLPPTTYYDVTVLKVRTKGGKEKAAAPGTEAATLNNNSPGKQQQQQTLSSHDASVTAAPQSITSQNGDLAKSQGHDTQEDDSGARKAALVSRMAQVGTPLFPLLPSAKAAVESKEAPTEEIPIPVSNLPPTPASKPSSTPVSNSTSIPASYSTSTFVSSSVTISASTPDLSCAPTCVLTSTTSAPVPAPSLLPSHPQAPTLALDSTLALNICQLTTSVARMSDKVDVLLGKVDKVEAGGPCGSTSSPASDPEALMALANGLVAHNERLRGDLEAAEKKLSESQASCTSLLAMNTELLEEKREMLKREDELRRKEENEKEDNREDSKDKEEPVMQDKEQQTEHEAEGDNHGLTPQQVRLLFKSTLSGLFRHLSSAFSEEEQYTRPQILHTVRSSLEVAYSTLLENLDEMGGVEGAAEVEGEEEKKEQEEKDEKIKEEENEKHHPEVEVMNGKNSPGEEIDEDLGKEERWKEKEEDRKPSEVQNNTFHINSVNLKEKESSENGQKEEGTCKKSASLCLKEAEETPKEDH